MGRWADHKALFLEQLLEQIDRPRIPGLAEPEQRLLSQLGITARAHNVNERGNALVPRPLREREDRRLAHLAVDTGVSREGVEALRRRRVLGQER